MIRTEYPPLWFIFIITQVSLLLFIDLNEAQSYQKWEHWAVNLPKYQTPIKSPWQIIILVVYTDILDIFVFLSYSIQLCYRYLSSLWNANAGQCIMPRRHWGREYNHVVAEWLLFHGHLFTLDRYELLTSIIFIISGSFFNTRRPDSRCNNPTCCLPYLSIPFLLMPLRHKEPWHQQAWFDQIRRKMLSLASVV